MNFHTHSLFPDYVDATALAAAEELALGGTETRGAVFTRPEVVNFILDLVDYASERPLHHQRILEPSFGGGDFLLPLIERLLAAWRTTTPQGTETAVPDLKHAIRAFELHHNTFASTRRAVIALLTHHGITSTDADTLASHWLTRGDFLLSPLDETFDYVVGNPPYVRQELIPPALLAAYRNRYPTMYDRADLYVPFIERSLSRLAPGGILGFICADRWTKNRYGGPLRQFVAKDFHLKMYVDMAGTPAFRTDVVAYPAITIISRNSRRQEPGASPQPTRVTHRPSLDPEALATLAALLLAPSLSPTPGTGPSTTPASPPIREVLHVTNGAEPWLFETHDQLSLLRRLEADFPTLEDAGCTVGIGVATGADKAFIGDYDTLDVEPSRKLPLAMTTDITSGTVAWKGRGVVNPFDDAGNLVDLAAYPRLARYLMARRTVIAARHCAQKNPARWYRTIDRITPALAHRPKLLIPDIKGTAHIVYEPGRLYPHHNLYFVTAPDGDDINGWDLRALQAVLLSAVTRLFIATYSTKMRGGFLRFQAQYLRRVRLPHWRSVPEPVRRALIDAAIARDLPACDRAAFDLYSLTPTERATFEDGA